MRSRRNDMEKLDPARMPSRRLGMRLTSVATAGALAATLGLAACSSSKGKASGGGGGTGNTQTGKESPQQAVTTAFGNVGKESGVRLTFSLPLSVDQIQQLNKSTSSTTMPPAAAEALSSGSIFFSVSTGHGEALNSQQAATDKDNSVDLGFTVKGNTPVEIRYVGQALYIHADIAQVLSDVGQANNASAAKVGSTLQQADQFVPGLGALGQGKWVELSKQSIQSLQPYLKQLQQQAQQSTGSTSETTLSQAQIRSVLGKLEADLRTAINGNVTFASLGNSNGRTEYSATANVSGFANSILPLIQRDLSSLPGFGSMTSNDISKAQKSIPPGQTAVVNLYVSNNKLSEADLDVTQFMKTNKPSFPVPVRMAVDNPGQIAAPPGATQLDLSKLPTLLQGLMGGLGSKTSG
ncbi:MAG TPA: hypothetical protein VFH58_00820 [Acidimicrobiales bacterium]|nr:hypothetical protein [Acidimicrobiales bacterium]